MLFIKLSFVDTKVHATDEQVSQSSSPHTYIN